LQVMSGLRFVRRAAKVGIPIVIVNRGATRGDDLATVKIDGGVAETLQSWRQEPSRVQDFGVGMIRLDAAANTS
jgi:hypothetical protein